MGTSNNTMSRNTEHFAKQMSCYAANSDAGEEAMLMTNKDVVELDQFHCSEFLEHHQHFHIKVLIREIK